MLYDILKDFAGSQDGRITEQFKAGTRCELSVWLADAVVPQGWARPVGAAIENKAVVTSGRQSGIVRRGRGTT